MHNAQENHHDENPVDQAVPQEKKQEEQMISIKESEYQKLLKDAEDYKEKFVRLFADYDNARKRTERERHDFVKYANEGLLSEFLAILDDLERSTEAAKLKHEDYTAFLKGIEMVMAHIYEMLKKNNVKPMDSAGKKFDPHYHEALLQEETDKADDDMILEEFQKGYFLGDRVLRTAKVKVAKKKNAN